MTPAQLVRRIRLPEGASDGLLSLPGNQPLQLVNVSKEGNEDDSVSFTR
jgi:hypothetical protein